MKILTVVGARPQFIKAAAVSRVLRDRPDVEELLVHTGQHFDRDMSDVFFRQMDIPRPDYHMEISGMAHGAMTGRMLEEIEKLINNLRPDWVLVYGDTNTTLAGALAAAKLHVPVAHVEAGLRSFNMRMPEEINRTLTDRVSSVLFCPTNQAVANLEAEGYAATGVEVLQVGDVMQDAALFYRSRSRPPDTGFPMPAKGFILATVHRAENTDDPERLAQVVSALNLVHNTQLPVVLPLHPRTRKCLLHSGLHLDVHVTEPVGYLEMVWLLERAGLVMTDSGGLQKEAYFFGCPCVTLRDETEWIELIELGVNRLAGADSITAIADAVDKMRQVAVFDDHELYGGGKAAERISHFFL